MLTRLLEVKPAINMYHAQYGGFKSGKKKAGCSNLDSDEWRALADLRTLLEPFKWVQQTLEGSKYVTSSLVPYLVLTVEGGLDNCIELAQGDTNSSVQNCAIQMKRDFKARFGDVLLDSFHPVVRRGARNRQVGMHPALMLAHALDPRFKDLGWVDEEKAEMIWKTILEEMVEREFKEQEEAAQDLQRSLAESQQQPAHDHAAETNHNSPHGRTMMSQYIKGRMRRAEGERSDVQQTLDRGTIRAAMSLELQKYKQVIELEYELETVNKVCPLKWWKQAHTHYPHKLRRECGYCAPLSSEARSC